MRHTCSSLYECCEYAQRGNVESDVLVCHKLHCDLKSLAFHCRVVMYVHRLLCAVVKGEGA